MILLTQPAELKLLDPPVTRHEVNQYISNQAWTVYLVLSCRCIAQYFRALKPLFVSRRTSC